MEVKKIGTYYASGSLAFLDIIAGSHGDDIELSFSSAVNLAVQFCALISENKKLQLTESELLFCCDILNGGAQMTEFKSPESVSIKSALESMLFGLVDAAHNNYGGELEKWDVDGAALVENLRDMSEEPCAMFALAIATRQFWSGGKTFANLKAPSECGDWVEWARQWVK